MPLGLDRSNADVHKLSARKAGSRALAGWDGYTQTAYMGASIGYTSLRLVPIG